MPGIVDAMRRELLVKRVFHGMLWTARTGLKYCPLPCYTSSPHLKIRSGHVVVLRGEGFDEPGWTAAAYNVEFPLHRLAADLIALQVPPSSEQPARDEHQSV